MLRTPDFDPATLADEFDPAIVTTFEHENVGDEPPFDKQLTAYGQYYDMYQAYVFAKDEVLPFIRLNGIQAVTPGIFLRWLDQAHGKIAKTLAQACGFKAGEITKEQITRWEWGGMTHESVALYLGGDDRLLKVIESIAKENAVSAAQFKKIVAVLNKIRNLKQLLKFIEQARKSGEALDPEKVGNTKLVLACRNKLLSAEDMTTLKELVVVCIDPATYPDTMKKFATDLLLSWKQCDAKNTSQLVDLLHKGYCGVAGIHPYANGNGRLATWLINVISRSLNRPSFLMREKGERFNAKSSYGAAIAQLKHDKSELFKAHVLQRIIRAEEAGHIEAGVEMQTAKIRHETYLLLKRMQVECRNIDLNRSCHIMVGMVEKQMIDKYGMERCVKQEPSIFLEATLLELELLQKFFKKYTTDVKANVSTQGLLSGGGYSVEQVAQLIDYLEMLSRQKGWVAYQKGKTLRLHLQDDGVANDVINTLNALGVAKAVLKRVPVTKLPVVELTEVSLEKLIERSIFLEQIMLQEMYKSSTK
jgi:hypothetical protein